MKIETKDNLTAAAIVIVGAVMFSLSMTYLLAYGWSKLETQPQHVEVAPHGCIDRCQPCSPCLPCPELDYTPMEAL